MCRYDKAVQIAKLYEREINEKIREMNSDLAKLYPEFTKFCEETFNPQFHVEKLSPDVLYCFSSHGLDGYTDFYDVVDETGMKIIACEAIDRPKSSQLGFERKFL